MGRMVVVVTTGRVVVVTTGTVVSVTSVVVVLSRVVDGLTGSSDSTRVVIESEFAFGVYNFATISALLIPGDVCANRAASPATWGAAIDVPEIVRAAVAPPIHDDVMFVPGAHKSTHEP